MWWLFKILCDILLDETYSAYPFWIPLILTLLGVTFQLLNFFVWLRITAEGSVPEMRIWSILSIKSDLKWCIHVRSKERQIDINSINSRALQLKYRALY